MSLSMAWFMVIGGLALVIIGARILVPAASEIAVRLSVPEDVIAATMVAFGTSLPELATAIVAGIRNHTDVTLGNVIGSNIFNILLIIGVLAMITPFHVAAEVMAFDIWVMAGVSLLIVPVMITGRRIGRVGGLVFLVLYAVFIVYQFEHPSLG